MVSADVDGAARRQRRRARRRVTLHDARVFGQSWERLVARHRRAAPCRCCPRRACCSRRRSQRLAADTAGTARRSPWPTCSRALGLIGPTGGVVADAVDQLVHDPGGLVRQRLAAAGGRRSRDAVATLLGPLGAGVDLDARTVTRHGGGDDTAGRFGWHADVTAGAGRPRPAQLRFGAATPRASRGRAAAASSTSRRSRAVAALAPARRRAPTTIAAVARARRRGASPALLARGRAEPRRPRRARADAPRRRGRPAADRRRARRARHARRRRRRRRARRCGRWPGCSPIPAGWLRSAGSLAAQPAQDPGAVRRAAAAARPRRRAGRRRSRSPTASRSPSPPPAPARGSRWTSTPAPGRRRPARAGRLGRRARAPRSSSARPARRRVGARRCTPAWPAPTPGRQAVHVAPRRRRHRAVPAPGRPAPTSRSSRSPASARSPRRPTQALPFLLDRLAEIPGAVGDAGRGGRRRARACAAATPDARSTAAALHRVGGQPGRRADRRACRRSSRPA